MKKNERGGACCMHVVGEICIEYLCVFNRAVLQYSEPSSSAGIGGVIVACLAKSLCECENCLWEK